MMSNTKCCFACDCNKAKGYWYPSAGHTFVCKECVEEHVGAGQGIYDDGRPGTEYVVIDVLAVGDDWQDNVKSYGIILHALPVDKNAVARGLTDAELIDAAKIDVAEEWKSVYRIIDDGEGGCCEIQDGETCRHIIITVTAC